MPVDEKPPAMPGDIYCVRFFGHCSCYNIIIIKLNCQSEVWVLRVKKREIS